ncbi:D-aspartate ligase [Halioglobus japonicus]|nr:D-aspartate ligase [Halioglobus japonicus]
MNTSRPYAIVLGLSPTGLYVARELGRNGTPLLGIDTGFASAAASRYFRKTGGVWYEADNNKLALRLLEFAAHLDSKAVLIPTSDHFIEFAIENYARLAPAFHMAQGYANVAEQLLDKQQFHQLCTRHSVATPGVWALSSMDEIRQLPEIPFPCILKPTLIHLAKPFLNGKKLFIVESRADLLALSQKIPKESGSWLVQEIIPGRESSIALVAAYASDNPNAGDTFTARKLRQYPPGFGSASRVISENSAEASDIAETLIASIGFSGVYGAEFKRDPRDGNLKIIEINPRPTLWFHASHAAGKRLLERAYCDMAGLPLASTTEQRDGILWHYALKDFASAMFYRYRGKDFVLQAPDLSAGGPVNVRCWPVFSLADPLPFVAELAVYMTKFIRRLF